MGPFEMVVAIVAIVMIASIIKSRVRARAEKPADSAETEMLHAELARLKDRIAVLERLATDKSRRLADEIDELRS